VLLRPYQSDVVRRTRDAFITARRPLVVMPCGAGKTVCFADMAHRHIQHREGNYVWFLVHRGELIDQTLATFDAFGISRDNIFVGMVQTISRHPDRYRKPTLIIFDEAHHATARTWLNIIEYFNTVPMIGLTATPARRDGKPLGDIFDTLIAGPDAEMLTAGGWLAEYDYYAPRATDLEFKMRGSDYDLDEFTVTLLKSKIYGEINKYIKAGHKTLIYSPSVAFSRSLGVTHFDGNTPDAERRRIVEDFRAGRITVLSSVDLVGEGFDIPDCDTVILLRPTQSLALFIQQAMRCMRPALGKRATVYALVGNVYRHGMPTEPREWSLTASHRCRNTDAEPDLLVRECTVCHRVYKGVAQICPYCGADNGKTRKQIEQDAEHELELVRAVARRKQGMAQTLEQLTELGRQRGYKNPRFWATQIIKSRKNAV